MDTQETPVVRKSFIERFGAMIFIGFVFALPVFVIPSIVVPFQAGKAMLFFVVVMALFIAWLLNRLKVGSVSIPSTLILGFAALLPVVYLVSAVFSNSVMEGLVGRGFELDTTLSILSFVFALFLVPQLFRTKQSIFNLYLGLFASFLVVFLFSFIRVIAGPDVFTLNVLNSSVSNLVGSWNDLGVFFGLISVLSLIMLEVIPPKGILRALLYGSLALSLIALMVVNFNVVWYIVGIFALALFVYSFAFARTFAGVHSSSSWRDMSRIPKLPLIVVFVALVFSITGSQVVRINYPSLDIGARISSSLNISQLEARPSWGTTLGVAERTLQTDTLLGVGPNQFVYEWLKYRPSVVNESAFWNIDFNFGIGIIPSAVVSVGVFGILAWLLFLAAFVYKGVRALRRPREDLFAYYLSITSFVGALYLWIASIFYTTSTVPFALAFILTGVFIASLREQGSVREKVISFTEEPSTRFVALIVTIVLIVASGTVIFLVGQRTVALAYFNRALATYNTSGDLASAEQSVRRAIAISGQDIFYRGLSEIALLSLNQLASQATAATPQEQLQSSFQALLGGAIGAAQAARDANPINYQNWVSLGRVYEAVVPLRINGAYESARAAYEEAVAKNPTSPAMPLTLARLEVLNNSNGKARQYIARALELKKNYTDAIFLLSQIEVAEGNIDEAIESVESASVLSPNDPTVFFQLGFLYYNDRNYTKAVTALERAVGLESSYANARYFLGLSYDRLNRKADAIAQFEEIERTNPGNEEVKFILSNLRDGKSAFSSVQPPLDNEPEKRDKPPIPEEETEEEI